MEIKQKIRPFRFEDPFEVYRQFAGQPSLLLESNTVNRRYSRNNLIAATQALEIRGRVHSFEINALTGVGERLLSVFSKDDFGYAHDLKISENSIRGNVERHFNPDLPEQERLSQRNISHVIRTVLSKFSDIDYRFAGLYGGFAYDFARNFMDFGSRFSEGSDDFVLFMPSNIIYLDGKKETGERFQLVVDGARDKLTMNPYVGLDPLVFGGDPVENQDMTLEEYADRASRIIEEIRNGRLMQCVLSRNCQKSLQKHPLDSYGQLREANPSPYNFFFDFGGGEFLYGASPELHVKVEGDRIEIRPLAGTSRRSPDAYEDFLLRRDLITDPKEVAEHTMLVDLARNDLYRLACPSSVEVTDFGTIEEYKNLYHISSGVVGRLRPGADAVTALLATIPAGTLAGAPKLEAMALIEELEGSRRGYYGGAIGYLGFNGDCNTGITIRSVYVSEGMSNIRSGAGIVLYSVPENEVREIQLKSEKQKLVLGGGQNE